MDVRVTLGRGAYRIAYRGLLLSWRVAHIRPDGVKCVIVDGDSLLLVRHTYGPGRWDLPGGGIRRGEAPGSTAHREMSEELGLDLDASAWSDLGELRSHVGDHRIRILGAEAHAPELHLDPIELAQAAWFPRDALPTPTSTLLSPILTAGPVATWLSGATRPSSPLAAHAAR